MRHLLPEHFFIAVIATLLCFPGFQPVFAQAGASERPNILWLTTEDMSPALGAYGDPYAQTPNLDRLAEKGVRFTRAYASAPICSPTRSALITGVHATSLGTMHLRMDMQIPDFIRTLPEYLREHGYFTTNNSKTDYNFSPEGRWDENGSEAHWRHRPEGKPFFSVFNFMITHEGPTNRDDEQDLEGLSVRHDPAGVTVPPFLPDTPEMRRILARNYDLGSVMDGMAGAILTQLEEDGLAENTIVFFFSDHGHGLPRSKRWLYTSGLQVPMMVYAPSRYRNLLGDQEGPTVDRLVSLVDVAPTVLSLAGVPIPEHMEGRAFLGPARTPDPEYRVFARDRADDVYDLARAVISERYLYVRHFMPHLPYVQRADIFGDQKTAYRELNRLFAEGHLDSVQAALYQPRPLEELYDLATDPHQLHNLAGQKAYRQEIESMRSRLRRWMLDTHDTALLPEPELIERAMGTTAYEMAHAGSDSYAITRILEAAERVGNPDVSLSEIEKGLKDRDPAVRYWSVVALQARGGDRTPYLQSVRPLLEDPSASVAIAAAELACQAGACIEAYPVLTRYLRRDERPWEALMAAAVVRSLGEAARPMANEVQATLDRHRGTAGGRYKDWLYSMFIGFAMDQTLADLGIEPDAE